MALTYTPDPSLGMACPDFDLPGVDGKNHSRSELQGAKGALVMFICNHCPYVVAVEDRLVALGRHFAGQSVKIMAISSNDTDKYPADSFENMKVRAKEKGYPFPYLHDESQEVAKSFGAVCTPDFFLFDEDLKLAYRGRLDDSWKDASAVGSEELKAAIEALLAGNRPSADQKPSMGCNIKWKPESLTI
jgi:peroxiredoxin